MPLWERQSLIFPYFLQASIVRFANQLPILEYSQKLPKIYTGDSINLGSGVIYLLCVSYEGNFVYSKSVFIPTVFCWRNCSASFETYFLVIVVVLTRFWIEGSTHKCRFEVHILRISKSALSLTSTSENFKNSNHLMRANIMHIHPRWHCIHRKWTKFYEGGGAHKEILLTNSCSIEISLHFNTLI